VNRVAAASLVFVLACGGKSEQAVPVPDPPVSDGGEVDAGTTDGGPCGCPARTPNPGDACDCPGVTCQFTPNFIACWRGSATCSETNRWLYEYVPNDSCPAELPTGSATPYCSGRGSCEYEVDVGCGPAIAKLLCSCTDAAWMLTLSNAELPELCGDCSGITSEAVCKLYPGSCVWESSGDTGVCGPRR
jgi:hypothetical protein